MASQSSQSSQLNQSTSAAESYDVERMVTEIVQYFLIMEQKRFPVKKAEITKLLSLKGNSMKTFKAVMLGVGKYLDEVFGYKVHEFDEKGGHFILLNQIQQPASFSSESYTDNHTILFLVLTSIHLAGGQIIEDEMWNMLDILGYKPDDYKKLVAQDFVRQLYVTTEHIPMTDPPKLNYLWGERARTEFTKLEILDFASKIYGFAPENFGTMYTNAVQERNENRVAQAAEN